MEMPVKTHVEIGGCARISALVLYSLAILAPVLALNAQDAPLYKNPRAPLEGRVEALFQALTPDERIILLSGNGFTTHSIPRLGIPPMSMVDATQGVRGGLDSNRGKATLFASGLLMSASWDVDLVRRIGNGVGTEALNKGTGSQILLGPGLNIIRSPLGGRSGEYMSEDPYLTSRMAVAYVEGLQQTGCAACAKHYACNNQEFDRDGVDVHVDERALREIYTPAFITVVKEAHVWAVMSAYNRVNGSYCSSNWYLQKQILKNEAGFDGLLMTDWDGGHNALAINEGCDLDMPGGRPFTPDKIKNVLQSGDLLQANVDEAVRRILRTIIRVGLMNSPRPLDARQVNSPEHQQLALEAAEKGIVLLKNKNNILPLDSAKIHSIALIGPTCKGWQMGTNGSGGVDPFESVNAYDGIAKRAGSGIKITYNYGFDSGYTGKTVPSSVLKPAMGDGTGLTGAYFPGNDFSSASPVTRLDSQVDLNLDQKEHQPAGINPDRCCVRWTGTLTAPVTGTYRMNLEFIRDTGGGRLFIDDKLIQDVWSGFDGSNINGVVDLVAGQAYAVRIEFATVSRGNHFRWTWLVPAEDLFADVVKTAREADVAVVFVGTGGEREGIDRASFSLPGVQNEMIQAVAKANPNTIVVLNNSAAVKVSDWVDQVPGLIEAWFPGQAGGTALASILFGDVNPSGKLVDTIGKTREDYPDFKHYPINPELSKIAHHPVVDYAEGIYVGYRFFDKKNVEPSFPFGHGLSYTTFQYANLKLSNPTMSPADKVTVTADITNTGQRAGAEVVQLYMQANQPMIDRPVRELKGFARVELSPGETKPISFAITGRDLAYCDVSGKEWKADAGTYSLELGSSSRDLRAKGEVQLTADYTEALPGLGAKSPYAPVPSLTSGKKATASSVQENYTPDLAIDDDAGSRWSSESSDPQWLAVDLGRPTLFDHARILWEAAYAKSFDLQISDDGQSWTTIYTNQDGQGGSERFFFTPVTARWVRILGTKRATPYGYSIYSFDLFPPKS